MPRALIALGANLGDRQHSLQQAAQRLAALAEAPPRVSTFHETTPIGGPAGQGAFLNAAAVLATPLAPAALHAGLKQIEASLGRQRGERWGARLIDLDLLLYDDADGTPLVVVSPELQVPHPRMSFRRFVLEPAAEVAPAMQHPLAGRSVSQLLEHLNTAPRYVLVLGRYEQQPRVLAAAASAASGARFLDAAWPAGLEAVYTTPSAPPDPSGRGGAPPIQLPGRGEVLAERGQPASDWTISAFETDRAPGNSLTVDTACPRLMVVLEDWETYARAASATATPADADRLAVLELARQTGCPLLCAGASDPAAQLNEITAAIAAME